MADVLPFRKRPPDGGGNVMCRNGHHRWRVDKGSRFDVRQGRLVTLERCARCGVERCRPS